jgi:hypothetical protein
MALTRAQRRDVADAAAYRILGEKTWKWRMVRDHLPHISGVVLLGAAGLGAYWTWTHIHLPTTAGVGHLPALFWVLLVGLAGTTAVVFRPGRPFTPFPMMVLRAFVVLALWFGLAGYAFSLV